MEAVLSKRQRIVQGRIGNIVIKNYGEKTVVSKYPDMSNIIASTAQVKKRSRFAEAVAYAKTINNSEVLKADYIKRSGITTNIYQTALKEYLRREW